MTATELLRETLAGIEQTLTIPAAEYVPAIGDVFLLIDQARAALSQPQQPAPAEPAQSIADHLFIDQRGDGIWLVCVEKVHESMEEAQQACCKWQAATAQPVAVTDEMVTRFLGWPLPKTFAPDCGITFDGRKPDAMGYERQWPIGTNLLTAVEARAMLEHVLGGDK